MNAELLLGAAPGGDLRRSLEVGPWSVVLDGLDAALAEELDRRLGGFLAPSPSRPEHLVVRVVGGRSERYLDPWKPGQPYRLEAEAGPDGPVVRSHHFALCREAGGAWHLGLAAGAGRDEPLGRVVENALRYVVARLAVEEGGVALHGAAVERDGRAYVLAGPSRSGKTAAVGRLAPAQSLGDDFAVVLPGDGGWRVPALPFDNSEQARADPPREIFPLAGLFRLFKSEVARIERPPLPLAIASLLACAAFPWAMPDLRDKVVAQAERLATDARFTHLHFALGTDLWPLVAT